jgi:hypothetical protein
MERPDTPHVEPGEIIYSPNGDVVIGAPTATAAGNAPPPGELPDGLIVKCPPGVAAPSYLVLEHEDGPIVYRRSDD